MIPHSYTFYDGPPFATGTPHYGHLLAGTIKDVVTRYAHQTGHHVERRFGWDTHGVPVEYEIDKTLGVRLLAGESVSMAPQPTSHNPPPLSCFSSFLNTHLRSRAPTM